MIIKYDPISSKKKKNQIWSHTYLYHNSFLVQEKQCSSIAL